MSNETARWLSPGDSSQIASALSVRFVQVFGHEPEGVFFAPGRANLNGEHIDFHGGRCLPMALPHGTYVAAAPRQDGILRLRTLDEELDTGIVEIPASAAVSAHPHDDAPSGPAETSELPDWTRYVSGVLWTLGQLDEEHAELRLSPEFGADLLIRSTLPIGAGLSSSASLECAAALAFVALGTERGAENPQGELDGALSDAERAVIAAACVRAETEVVGAGTGGLDQTTSMRASEGKLLSLDCRDFSLRRVDISFLLRSYRFIAVDTGQPHRLVGGEFSARRAESEAAAALLGVERLRDTVPDACRRVDVDEVLEEFDRLAEGQEEINGYSTAACRRRLRHAVTEMMRSEKIHKLLTGEAHGVDHTAETIGDVMSAGHTSMRENAQVSFEMADQVVDTALREGALGARLIGGGFGGSVLTLVPKDRAAGMTKALAALSPKVRFLEVLPSAPARVV
ncbi:galactokinase [Nesterenkonia flava]|uniref:Galactokinase family protein n=1 Tax=Nesterenkonia flava TaxID=469799 RepID=A0ABU1FSZ3_9MICC|nr:galactokinase family protein [Nesterenkonia flava]MDR5711764.1 galactokinase family protein [Nesterenkonia flava]